jgi:hypothetical protein
MGDPDDLNPGPNKVWSFANGCDVSHGDSGSAMFNRNTGEIVGLIWTGRIPKDASVQKSDYLREILDENNSKEIWQQLSYAVPAEKIKDVLTQELEAGKHSSTTKTILENMLNK